MNLVPKGQPMPQTVESYKELAQRDLELIEDQREEINKLKCKVNDLSQKLQAKRAWLDEN